MTKPADHALRVDVRRARAQSLTAAILRVVEPYVVDEYRAMAEVSRALDRAFYEMGTEVVTDDMRREYGLPPRGPDGWTIEELHAMEARRLELLRRPMPPVVWP